MNFAYEPSKGVRQGFQNNYSPHPAVQQVVSVERDVQRANQWIVPPSKEYKGDHVQHGERTGAIAQLRQRGCQIRPPVDVNDAESDVYASI